MSANAFLTALQETLRKEGRLVNNPADRGEITDYGVSLRFLRLLPLVDADINGDGHVTEADIRALDNKPSTVAHLYRKYFWDHYKLDNIPHPRIAVKAFDLLVWMRSVSAVKIIQRGLRSCGRNVDEDGVLGSETFGAIAEMQDELRLFAAMRSESFGHIQLIVAKDPSQAEFFNGWKNRAYS